jgi:hypothetical protein
MIASTKIPLIMLVLATPLAAQQPAQEEVRTTLRGVVVDGLQGDPLSNTIVLLVDDRRGLLADSLGRFTFSSVPVGVHLLAIKQYGYAEVNLEVDVVQGQAPVRIELRPGPLALEGFTVIADHLATMNKKLKSRRNTYGRSVWALEQGRLASSGALNVAELLEIEGSVQLGSCGTRSGPATSFRSIASRMVTTGICVLRRGNATEPMVYIDEAPIIGSIEVLGTFRPYELYLVEVYSGGLEIRAYTHWYMERMAARPRVLFPIGLRFARGASPPPASPPRRLYSRAGR